MEHDKTPLPPAAQDDVLGEATTNKGVPPAGADRKEDVPPAAGAGRREPRAGEAAPGKDENQAGFLHDPDKRFRP